MRAYIFLNSVGVFNAQRPLTHQNRLLLVAKRLRVQNGKKSTNIPLYESDLYIHALSEKCTWTQMFCPYLWMVPHDVVEACQQAQAGTDLHMHGSVHVVEQVEGLVDQLTALLQEPCKATNQMLKKRNNNNKSAPKMQNKWIRLTLLHLGLSTLEEMEGVRGFGVHMLYNGEDVQDVLLCEGGLVATVKVVLLDQNLH